MSYSFYIQGGLLALGLWAWGSSIAPLKESEFDHEPNFLTLKGSSFGRLIAIAMRGPANTYWNGGGAHALSVSGDQSLSSIKSDRLEDDGGEGEIAQKPKDSTEFSAQAVRHGFLDQITKWKTAYYARTNPYGSTKVHRAFIMGEAEKRFRVSYEMDPSNFSAYGSYFLFLSEALSTLKKEGGQEELERRATAAALMLSHETLQYCLERQDEPGALLTAAAASSDYMQVFYREQGDQGQEKLRELLKLQRQCIQKYHAIKEEMVTTGVWEEFPILRREEMETRASLLEALQKNNVEILSRNVSSEDEQEKEENNSI